MEQLKILGDKRELVFCTFCGGHTGTRDHCPSRVLLDEPYPDNLPVVPSCAQCNSSFSADEEYLACLVGCVLADSTDPSKMRRPKIQRILSQKPALRSRLERARVSLHTRTLFDRGQQCTLFLPEQERVNAVITKLAQGHALHELHQPCREKPDAIKVKPFTQMTPAERKQFEQPAPLLFFPEVGSRAMQRCIVGGNRLELPWIKVQGGLYRFLASLAGGVEIRIVINEYLACRVHWIS
jgi:hypothetical protein